MNLPRRAGSVWLSAPLIAANGDRQPRAFTPGNGKGRGKPFNGNGAGKPDLNGDVPKGKIDPLVTALARSRSRAAQRAWAASAISRSAAPAVVRDPAGRSGQEAASTSPAFRGSWLSTLQLFGERLVPWCRRRRAGCRDRPWMVTLVFGSASHGNERGGRIQGFRAHFFSVSDAIWACPPQACSGGRL
jgi:hypothetical protein